MTRLESARQNIDAIEAELRGLQTEGRDLHARLGRIETALDANPTDLSLITERAALREAIEAHAKLLRHRNAYGESVGIFRRLEEARAEVDRLERWSCDLQKRIADAEELKAERPGIDDALTHAEALRKWARRHYGRRDWPGLDEIRADAQRIGALPTMRSELAEIGVCESCRPANWEFERAYRLATDAGAQ